MMNPDGPRFRRRHVAPDPPDPVSRRNKPSPAAARSRETPDRPVCRRADSVQSRDLSEPTSAPAWPGISSRTDPLDHPGRSRWSKSSGNFRDYFGVSPDHVIGQPARPAAGSLKSGPRNLPISRHGSAMLVSMPRLSLQFGCLAIALLSLGAAQASECPSSRSEIATDRPDVTNSSLVVPTGSIQSENGINTSGQSAGAGFDGSNSRLRFGVAPCLEWLIDMPSYVGRLSGTIDTGFTNVTPAVKWQIGALPEATSLSVVVGAGLTTGTP